MRTSKYGTPNFPKLPFGYLELWGEHGPEPKTRLLSQERHVQREHREALLTYVVSRVSKRV